MNNKLVRMLLVLVAWIVFTFISTAYYMAEIHDVGGTFWAMGFISFPIVLLIVWWFDNYLLKQKLLHNRAWALTLADSALAILLYYPGFILVWRIVYLISNT